jgi:hypothetical protein
MKDERLDDLIDAHFNVAMNDGERRELEERLLHSATDRMRFWELAESHVLVHEGIQQKIAASTSPEAAPRRVLGHSRWLQWRPLTAAAAGLVFGLFTASAVWAYAVNQRRVSLFRESFEFGQTELQNGFPARAGEWSGDEARVVEAGATVSPKDGRRMLKIEPSPAELFSRVHYIVDLQKQPQLSGATMRTIELKAAFHPMKLDKKDRYVLRAAAFAQEPPELVPRWMTDFWAEIDEHALAYAARGVTVPPGNDGWQTISLTIDVPPGSRILVISLWAATMDGQANNRLAHYLDDVRLSAVINEPAP